MIVPLLRCYHEHPDGELKTKIVTEQKECPAASGLSMRTADGETSKKCEREDSLDLPFRDGALKEKSFRCSYCAAGALLAEVAAPADFGVER